LLAGKCPLIIGGIAAPTKTYDKLTP